MRTVTPYVFYDDVAAAVQWLSTAFGFREMVRYSSPDGTVIYAELGFGDERVMLSQYAAGIDPARAIELLNSLVYVTVDDVEDHYAQAVRAGARIVHEPADMLYGLRQYTAADPQGQRWIFAEQVRDVLPEEWGGEQISSPSLESLRAGEWPAA